MKSRAAQGRTRPRQARRSIAIVRHRVAHIGCARPLTRPAHRRASSAERLAWSAASVHLPCAASAQVARAHAREREGRRRTTCVTLNGSGIQLAVGPQPLWLRNHNSGLAQRIMEQDPVLPLCQHQDAGIEDERQYRAPLLPVGLLLAAMSQMDSYHI
ncbi:cycloartenol synthase family protein [Dorcoceras hygrometricum]|uniref:Cycloartenol synthase family protein n=1 Tax=Dorcoceras hygrometricum TaxID=472368 RepID=A0A2Z7DI41_9LAMI|nr:cycloartenol synthase family protein [Dorcoceras hygrometricum]